MIRKENYKSKIELPYNPDDVNIRLQHFRVSDLVEMIQGERFYKDTWIDIWGEDDLQRNINLWNNVQKSLFIESLMIKLPIPLFYFDGSQQPWRVVDGLQRLHTIISFIEMNSRSKFSLTGLEFLVTECDGKYFEELPGYLRARILNAEIEAYVINPGTPPEVKYSIFKRINTGGLRLKGQEIRNAFFRGVPAQFTKKLASNSIFHISTDKKISSRRMEDREYVTRFIAFQLFYYEEYISKMDAFLTTAMMELYNRNIDELNELEDAFITSLNRAYSIFGGGSFYRVKKDGSLHKKPNKALFDTLSWNLHILNEQEFSKIENNKNEFIKEYVLFINEDVLFIKAINDSTSSRISVLNRFSRLNDFIKKFIQ